jgi:KipI family sensor histidine kinase inhibitor
MNYERNGESGIRIVFGDTIDAEIHRMVRQYFHFVRSLALAEIVDITPSFRSCLIHFDRDRISFESLTAILRQEEAGLAAVAVPEPDFHEIPVRYGGEYGPDMEFVSSYVGLTEEEVVEIHSSAVYIVFTVGFTPGFPYMGTLDRRLYAPRLETPRLKVPEGSVGIAQLQTGIYSFESPAGWRIIGKTETRLFDPSKPPFSLLKMGDHVRFVPV